MFKDLTTLTDVIGATNTLSLGLKSELDQLNPLKTVSVASLQRKISELVVIKLNPRMTCNQIWKSTKKEDKKSTRLTKQS